MLIHWIELPKAANVSAEFLEKHAAPKPEMTKRRYPRLKTKNLMKYGNYPEPSDWHISNLLDLSEAGLKFVSDTRLGVGRMLEIKVLVDSTNRQIPATGKVAWMRSRERGTYYVGVSLIELKQEDRDLIRQLIQ